MARRARVTTWYARQVGRIITPGSARSLAIARTIHTLTATAELPGASDFESSEVPFGQAWVRRVGGRNLWLWYRFNQDEVVLVMVTTEPPVPVDGGPRTG